MSEIQPTPTPVNQLEDRLAARFFGASVNYLASNTPEEHEAIAEAVLEAARRPEEGVIKKQAFIENVLHSNIQESISKPAAGKFLFALGRENTTELDSLYALLQQEKIICERREEKFGMPISPKQTYLHGALEACNYYGVPALHFIEQFATPFNKWELLTDYHIKQKSTMLPTEETTRLIIEQAQQLLDLKSNPDATYVRRLAMILPHLPATHSEHNMPVLQIELANRLGEAYSQTAISSDSISDLVTIGSSLIKNNFNQEYVSHLNNRIVNDFSRLDSRFITDQAYLDFELWRARFERKTQSTDQAVASVVERADHTQRYKKHSHYASLEDRVYPRNAILTDIVYTTLSENNIADMHLALGAINNRKRQFETYMEVLMTAPNAEKLGELRANNTELFNPQLSKAYELADARLSGDVARFGKAAGNIAQHITISRIPRSIALLYYELIARDRKEGESFARSIIHHGRKDPSIPFDSYAHYVYELVESGDTEEAKRVLDYVRSAEPKDKMRQLWRLSQALANRYTNS